MLQVWNKHAKELRNFVDPGMQKQAVFCLNELITNALELVPDCIKYMSRLHNQSVFNFCAIPQVGDIICTFTARVYLTSVQYHR